MTQEELREISFRYNVRAGLKEQVEILELFSQTFLKIIQNHHKDAVYGQADADAKMILQMMLTKTLYLRKLIDGVSFKSTSGPALNSIIDPTILAMLVRNIFETAGMFNTIYTATENTDQKELVYILWVIAGLKYRQRFVTNILSDETKKKQEGELENIAKFLEYIEQSKLFLSLDQKGQEKIKNRIKEKEYLIKFEGSTVHFLNWGGLSKTMGMDEKLFSNAYTFFSLYTHPSYVSVFQFAEMFAIDNPGYLELTSMNLNYARFFLSIFLADYIKLFPATIKTFEELSLVEQIILNFPNKLARGNHYSINQAHEALG